MSGYDFILKVLDPSTLNEKLKGRSETFKDLDNRQLQFPSRKLPYRRLLSTHSIFALQKAREEGWLTEDQYTAAETNAQDLMAFSLDEEAQDRINRFLNDKSNELIS